MKTIEFIDFRSKHIVLTEHMNEKELRENIRKNGRISAKVFVDLTDLVNNDIEWFNDEVSELITGSDIGLSDINYSVVGRNTNNKVLIKVDAFVEFDNL